LFTEESSERKGRYESSEIVCLNVTTADLEILDIRFRVQFSGLRVNHGIHGALYQTVETTVPTTEGLASRYRPNSLALRFDLVRIRLVLWFKPKVWVGGPKEHLAVTTLA
jgi:hypothetical protein